MPRRDGSADKRQRPSRRATRRTPAWIAEDAAATDQATDGPDTPLDQAGVPADDAAGHASQLHGSDSAHRSSTGSISGPPVHGGDAGGPQDEPARRRGMVGGRNLPVAIAVGVLLLAAVAAALWWHPWAFGGILALLTTIAYLEIRRVLASVDLRIDAGVAIVATWVMIAGAFRAGQLGQLAGILVLVLGAFLWHLADPVRHDVVRSAALTVLFGLWVGFLASHAVLLIDRPVGGTTMVIAVLGAAALMDTGGYVTGVAIGRHAVAPSVSPNKTWEGFLGGLVFAGLGGFFGLPLIDATFEPLVGGVVAVAVALAAFVGDLVQSMVKRDLGIKDLGRFLPGHGGVLDRVDGILWALPVGYYLIEVLGV